MGRIVGIDLGTTYSAIAIPEERDEEGFFTVRTCPGVSIIQDRFKNRITPSVVAEDSRGEIVVGRTAKGRAGFSPPPIAFAKRKMGEDYTWKLDRQGSLTPVQVSAHILRYLKEMAEERLGEPVDEAVITVPAYFHLRAKQETEKAGELAGLRVAQVAPEPVAAALMYCAGDDRDPLRVMTYDLGGGTFDVAVLEKRDQTITEKSMLTVDGDRFLGGYNFDQLLTDWLLDEIRAKGYRMEMDDSHPQTGVIRSKLMVIAEREKIKLSNVDYSIMQEENLGLSDDDGNPVSLEGIELHRSTFEEMISSLVEGSIDICRRALEKATPPISANTLDEILMVGGSSRIPMIGARLEAEFGIKPKLVEPDLCVCLGAAIIAGTKAKSIGRFKLNRIPEETFMPYLAITGHVLPASPGENLSGLSVRLVSADGSYNSTRKIDQDGSFVFDQVNLVMDEDNQFIISLVDASAFELDTYTFHVRHSSEGDEGMQTQEIPNVLSKKIQIELREGMFVIAPERTALPYTKNMTAYTADNSGSIRIEIFEENNRLGEILLTDIDKSLPIGSTVDIQVTIQQNYTIIGTAQVKSLAQEASVTIDIPVPEKKSLDELTQLHRILEARAEEAISAAPPGVVFGSPDVRRLKERLKEVTELLSHSPVEEAMVQDRQDEIESLIRKISEGWKPDPPKIVFDESVAEAREALKRAIRKDDAVIKDGYDQQIDAIEKEAASALQAQNSARWKDSFNNIDQLCRRLDKLGRIDDGGDQQPADPQVYLLTFAQYLSSLESSARHSDKYEQNKAEFERLASQLKAINPQAPDAMALLTSWYMQGYQPLKARIESSIVDDGKLRRER